MPPHNPAERPRLFRTLDGILLAERVKVEPMGVFGHMIETGDAIRQGLRKMYRTKGPVRHASNSVQNPI